MSGGFGIIIGYVFAFLALMGVFFGALTTYNDQISEQEQILKTTVEKSVLNLNYDYEFLNPFYSSGRLTFILENGNQKLLFKEEDNNYCFNFYVNSNYVSQIDSLFVNFQDKSLINNYRFISENGDAIFTIKSKVNESFQNIIKTSSCEQIEKIYYVTSENLNWWNSSFERRKKITVRNVASVGINDYQIPIILNNSNFNFAEGREEEIRFALPIKENFVLDLPFDDNTQLQYEYSKYSNVAYLGTGVASEPSDPTFTSEGIILWALNFDGVDDKITISASNSLQLNNSLTYSMWVKWGDSGNNFQYLYANGVNNNSIQIINNGGANDNKVQFQLNISGTVRTLVSSTTLDNNWHLITATFDGYNMNLYIDKTNVANATYLGDVVGINGVNYIASSGSSNFFNGTIDEVKILNFALSQSEVEKLYHNNLMFKELDFYVSNWEPSLNKAKVFVKLPYIHSNSNVTFDMYYYNKENLTSSSNIETTFSYEAPRTVGYVVSERADLQNGIIVSSLYDNNIIYVGSTLFSLNRQVSSSKTAANTLANDTVKMKYLAQVEGNTANNGGDMIVPISWAGTEFTYTLFENNPDRLCFIAPFSNSAISITVNGGAPLNLNAIYGGSSVCSNTDLLLTGNVRIVATTPVLVFSAGTASYNVDSLVLIPSSSENWFGVGSASMYVTSVPSGSTTSWYDSNGASGLLTLTAATTGSRTAQGNDGNAPAFKLVNSGKVGVQTGGDSDGNEQITFAPLTELGTYFGSAFAMDYVAVASPYSNANCSIYSDTNVLLGNIINGVGQNGIYAYNFGVGNDVQYAAVNWYLRCDKPVWPYYESTTDDETNLFGHLQMRQYIYPEPTISIN